MVSVLVGVDDFTHLVLISVDGFCVGWRRWFMC